MKLAAPNRGNGLSHAASLALAAALVASALATAFAAPPGVEPNAVSWFKPRPHQFKWNYQLSVSDTSLLKTDLPGVNLYVLDLFGTPAERIAALKTKGINVICYFSAGSFEKGRPDNAKFPASVKGQVLDGWPDERWLDVRNINVLKPIMIARMQLARAKGCVGVDPDNVDAFSQGESITEVQQNTGFPIRSFHQLAYNRMLANEAHKLGLGIGLKNCLSLIPQLVTSFDWIINEQCLYYDECHLMKPFVAANKAAFSVEYDWKSTTRATVCRKANSFGLDTLLKNLDLTALPRVDCWTLYGKQ